MVVIKYASIVVFYIGSSGYSIPFPVIIYFNLWQTEQLFLVTLLRYPNYA